MNPDESNPRVSLRDIAAKLGVSHSTISLALRNHPRISPAMRETVKRTAEAMGYRPDPMLAALANYRRGREIKPVSSCVAWINAWPKPEKLRALKEFDGYWRGASKAAEKFGFRLEEFRLGPDCSPKRLHQILRARSITGLLLPPHQTEPDWGNFPWNEYCLLRFGRSLAVPACHVVTSDQIANSMLGIQRIRERGYRRIGFVSPGGDFSRRGLQWERGYIGGQRMIHDPHPLPVLELPVPPEKQKAALANWMKKHQPDAIFTSAPNMAELLGSLGFRVPEDVGLAVTSVLDAGADAGIDQHPEEIGRVAFLMLNSILLDRANGIPSIFRQILVEGSWVDGHSLPERT